VVSSGWGLFMISTFIVLKPGFQFDSEIAQPCPEGRPKSLMLVEWNLVFDGVGAQSFEEWEAIRIS
jgi:hypothetical protein